HLSLQNAGSNRKLPAEIRFKFGLDERDKTLGEIRLALNGFEPVWQRILQHAENRRAIEFGAQTCTYGSLSTCSGKIAAHLASQYEPESLIAVCMPRTPQLVAILLGILRAGCAFLPIDAKYPWERTRFMLEDAAPKLYICGSSCQPSTSIDCPAVTPQQLLEQCNPYQPISVPVSAHNLAYSIFTSGSTGQPKAALLEHGGLTNLVREQCRIFRVTPMSRVLQFASIGFDAAVSEIFVTLHAGGTLCLATENELTPGPRLANLLRTRRISDVTLSPSILARLGRIDLPELRTLVVAGEPCSGQLAQQWSVGRTMINAYGPTEATVCVTTDRCTPGSDETPSMGFPIENVTAYVLDDQGNLAHEGELYVGGVGLARGYLRRPELTQQRFVYHRIENQPTVQRLYRTGDRVRQERDGRLTFLGRVDDEIKINGVRIDLGEIQALIERDPFVMKAVVCRESIDMKTKLLGFVQWRPGVQEDWDRLWSQIREFFPVSCWPAELIPVPEFPLTSSGKLDRNRLLQHVDEYRHGMRHHLRVVGIEEPPIDSNGINLPSMTRIRELQNCWREVLPNTPHEIYSDFFLSGGDSLSAMEFLARIAEKTGEQISMAEFARNPTLLGIAACLNRETALHEPTEHLIKLQTGTSEKTAVCIHPGGGHIFCYHPLAQALQPDWTLFAMQAQGVDGLMPPHRNMNDMADAYARRIEQQFAGRSIDLLGWSFGGLVAYEIMTRLADSQVMTVRNLWVVDAAPLYSLVVLRSLFPDENLSLRKIINADQSILSDVFSEMAVRTHLVPPQAPPHEIKTIFKVFMANVEATLGYRPPRFTGRTNLVLARGGCSGMRHDVVAEWKAISSNLRVQYVEGNHLTILQEPNVHGLAKRIQQAASEFASTNDRRAA
ncbi:MAG: amino acid adenylation domain-containing protein, partial [Planctomycetota bacterium]|nr:amino acid adenylation domain-containing protein [Planctomycetota bacterium]